MVAGSGATATTSSARLILIMSWCLFQLQLHMTRGFLAPAPHSLASLGAVDVATRATTVSTEAKRVPGAAVSSCGGDPAGPGRSLSLASSAFQEFVERRKSGARRVVLDLRPGVEFRQRHLEGSTSIPVDELARRLLELPPPFGEPISIVGNDEVRDSAENAPYNKDAGSALGSLARKRTVFSYSPETTALYVACSFQVALRCKQEHVRSVTPVVRFE